jgi:hypothetical protein
MYFLFLLIYLLLVFLIGRFGEEDRIKEKSFHGSGSHHEKEFLRYVSAALGGISPYFPHLVTPRLLYCKKIK